MQRYKHQMFDRWISAALMICLLVSLAMPGALGEEAVSAGQSVDPTVRVLLRRLGITDRMDITLFSAYGMHTSSGAELHFAAGSELSFQLKQQALYLYYQGLSMQLGQGMTLTRYADAEASEIGFRFTNYPALYIGDLHLYLEEEAIRPVLSIHVEDYLLGVVPYEMSNSFPLEALKAQAVAARTYVLRRQTKEGNYDVVDTTNDQVFKGYIPGYAQAEKAVADTYGICGFYKGKLAQCYYAASNGGQRESVNVVWPSKDDYSYYGEGEDTYDLENPASVVKKFTIQKKYTNEGQDIAPYGLRRLLSSTLEKQLMALGYDPAPESVQVRQISNLTLDTPVEGEVSHRMSMLHMTVQISGRTRTDPEVPQEDLSAQEQDEEVSLFTALPASSDLPDQTPPPDTAETLTAAETPIPTPAPTPVPVYGDFTLIKDPYVLDIPIFTDVENAFAMNISSNYENEIWQLTETPEAYNLEARRFGHGLGMSQRGAQWMAERYQKTYQEILGFYYPGMELLRFDETDIALQTAVEPLSDTPGPAPSATPRPTLMPATMPLTGDQWYATVTGIAEDSSLNLRSLPDMSGEIVMRLFKTQRLLILERCQEAGWVKVATDVAEGYVLESYLTAE